MDEVGGGSGVVADEGEGIAGSGGVAGMRVVGMLHGSVLGSTRKEAFSWDSRWGREEGKARTDEQRSVVQHPFGAAHTVTPRLVQAPLKVFVE